MRGDKRRDSKNSAKRSDNNKLEKHTKRLLNKKLSRRDFIKKSIIGIAGIGIAGYTINNFYVKGNINDFSKSFRNDAPQELWRWSREADYYTRLSDGSVECNLCPHECRIGLNDRGFCRTRVNTSKNRGNNGESRENKLYTIAYGNPCSVHVDPIEKKPLYHFLPESKIFSIATAGCNLRCLNCQNWSISQFKPEETTNQDLMPESVVQAAIRTGSKSIAYTYSEPIAFYEYTVDTSRLAKKSGLKNVWVTAGYINEKPLREAAKVMDAANVDLKGFNNNFYKKVCEAKLEPVLNTLKILKEEKVWFEVTRLIVPVLSDDLNDIKEMCNWLYKNIGPDHPLHFSRFHPAYKVEHLPPTPIDLLKNARKLAMDSGLNYVYVGNVPGYIDGNTTFCPKCGSVVIKRQGYTILENNLKDNSCSKCGEKIAGVWGL